MAKLAAAVGQLASGGRGVLGGPQMETERLGTEVTMAGGSGSWRGWLPRTLGQTGLFPLWSYLFPQHLLILLGASEGVWPTHCELGAEGENHGVEADLDARGQRLTRITPTPPH